jgi:hypothetical protein
LVDVFGSEEWIYRQRSNGSGRELFFDLRDIAMTSSRKKPGVAFWATVVVVGVALYAGSVGPGQYLCAHRLIPEWAIPAGQFFYAPLAALPDPIAHWIELYADWFAHTIP